MKRGGPLQRKTAMNRGSGFARKPWPRSKPIEDEDAANDEVMLKPLPKLTRTPDYAVSTRVQAAPKTVAHRNRRLLDLARGKPCLLCVAGVCNGNWSTTVAAHSNWVDLGGKSGARKADDCFSVWGCMACHTWLDQGGAATGEEKRAVFIAGMRRQVSAWHELERDVSQLAADRQACRWALELLAREGYAQEFLIVLSG